MQSIHDLCNFCKEVKSLDTASMLEAEAYELLESISLRAKTIEFVLRVDPLRARAEIYVLSNALMQSVRAICEYLECRPLADSLEAKLCAHPDDSVARLDLLASLFIRIYRVLISKGQPSI